VEFVGKSGKETLKIYKSVHTLTTIYIKNKLKSDLAKIISVEFIE
tara:strand:+ start:444 stop:578 length:135 start_codon:yes stop_codon:yes gene_type:complete